MAEGFFRFPDLGALEMAHFEGDFFERGRDQSEGGHPGRVPVAGDDLARDGSRLQAEPGADLLFGFRADVAEGPDGSRDLAHSQVFRGSFEAAGVAAQLVIPEGELQSERHRFGMDSVRTADLNGVLELPGSALKRGG